jgi:hypothetical protein
VRFPQGDLDMAHQQRDLKRERTWRRHIERQRASGQTIRAYCEFHRLREASFYFWRQEIARRDSDAVSRPAAAPAFVPVTVIDRAAGRAEVPIVIRLPPLF